MNQKYKMDSLLRGRYRGIPSAMDNQIQGLRGARGPYNRNPKSITTLARGNPDGIEYSPRMV
jgi:hypothetical protein